jgi:PAS domain S-box-containing protein
MQAVIEAKRTWERTFDAMSDGIVVHDEGMRIVRVNRAFARLVRSAPARLVGRDLLELLDETNATAVRRACARVVSTRRPLTFELDDPSLGGSVSISLSRLPTKQGAYFIQTLRDITDERQMQERLAQASKLASIGQLAAGVAHEINTPLATITGCAQSLVRQLTAAPELVGGERWEAISDRLTTIVEQSFRCKKITRDLLDYAKPTKATLVPTDVERVAREAVETVGRERAHGRVRTKVAGEPGLVATDPDLLRQVLVNLLVNALDAVEASGSTGGVVLECRFLKGVVRITVRDSGAGIAPGDIERIFDPFFTTKPPGRGTGLGLSISQSLVASLGGRIEVSSRVGRGSRFSIALPRDLDGRGERGE